MESREKMFSFSKYTSTPLSLVALSDLEANKYNKVLKWKNRLISNPNLQNNPASSMKPPITKSEHGDLEVTRIRQHQKQLTLEEIERAAIEYLNGMSTGQLAEKYGCHRTTVSKNLKNRGIHVTNRRASEKINVEEVISMYANMINTEQIAKKFEVSPNTITKYLRDNGIKIRTRWDY